ncbi:MAG: hypothetical protein AVDCRST_MAG64-1129, partial [uncultured Phycisphaerae bacterium]
AFLRARHVLVGAGQPRAVRVPEAAPRAARGVRRRLAVPLAALGHQGRDPARPDEGHDLDLRGPARRHAVRRAAPVHLQAALVRPAHARLVPDALHVVVHQRPGLLGRPVRHHRQRHPLGRALLPRPRLLQRLGGLPRPGGRHLHRRPDLRPTVPARDPDEPPAPHVGLRPPPARLRADQALRRVPPHRLHAARPGRRVLDDRGLADRRLAARQRRQEARDGHPHALRRARPDRHDHPLQVGGGNRVPVRRRLRPVRHQVDEDRDPALLPDRHRARVHGHAHDRDRHRRDRHQDGDRRFRPRARPVARVPRQRREPPDRPRAGAAVVWVGAVRPGHRQGRLAGARPDHQAERRRRRDVGPHALDQRHRRRRGADDRGPAAAVAAARPRAARVVGPPAGRARGRVRDPADAAHGRQHAERDGEPDLHRRDRRARGARRPRRGAGRAGAGRDAACPAAGDAPAAQRAVRAPRPRCGPRAGHRARRQL